MGTTCAAATACDMVAAQQQLLPCAMWWVGVDDSNAQGGRCGWHASIWQLLLCSFVLGVPSHMVTTAGAGYDVCAAVVCAAVLRVASLQALGYAG